MKSWSKQYGVVFLIGFVAFFAALAYSTITTGELLTDTPFIVALRYFGLGEVAAGMALWVVKRREEAEKPALTPLFGFLIIGGSLLLILALLFPNNALSQPAGLGGLALTVSALVVGLIAMIFFPAYPKPLAKTWPVGAEAVLTRFREEDDHHHHEHDEEELPEAEAAAPDDLTKVEGIGPKVQSILIAAGVQTFAALAGTEPEKIREILLSGDFKAPFDPTSWPEQAKLASDGAWDELENLQDKLKGGRA